MRKLILSALVVAGLAGFASVATVASANEGVALPKQEWSWQGVFGRYDRASAQRGLQVYRDVCAACHSLKLVSYRHLSGIGLTEDQIKAVAAEKEVTDGPNDNGDMFKRPARASDPFVSPFANDQAARVANNGALPPDLSLINKARNGGADYVYNLLLGYEEAPAGVVMNDGMSYNKFFPGHQIGMPQLVTDDAVTYADGTKATAKQIATDITTFLQWAAQPELDARKALGAKVMGFLIVLTIMFYALKRRIWSDVH